MARLDNKVAFITGVEAELVVQLQNASLRRVQKLL